jgi:predicted permease
MHNYLKTTFRNLWKNKTINFLNIGGLAIGTACAALIFLWVEDEMTFNHQFKNRDYLYSIKENQVHSDEVHTVRVTPAPLAPALKTDIPGIKNTTRTTNGTMRSLLMVNDNSFYEEGLYVDSSFFSMFNIHFIHGNASHAFDQHQAIVITERVAKKFFDTKNPVGKILKIEGELFTVTGVVESLSENTSLKFDWLAPFDLVLSKFDWMSRWDANGVMTYVELQHNANAEAVNKQLLNYLKNTHDIETKCFLFPLSDWHLYDSFKDGVQDGNGQIKYVRLFIIIAWIVILAACINFMNLATSRSERRAKEVGVRKSLGAARNSLISQFIMESLIMSFMAIVLAAGIMYISIGEFNLLVEKHLTLNLFSPTHLAGLIVIGLICGLVAGSYPAFYLSSFNPIVVLKGLKSSSSANANVIRRALVVTQFVVSIGLIICTIIIYQQVQHTKNRNLGYQKQNVIYVDVRGKLQEHFSTVKTKLLNTGVVDNVSLSVNPVVNFGWYSSSNYTWSGIDPTKNILVTVEGVTPDYIATLGMKVSEGRDFNENAEADVNNIIINKSLARLMGTGSQVGNVISTTNNGKPGDGMNVIGVVDDFVFGNVYSGEVAPMFMTCNPTTYNYMTLRFKDGSDLQKSISAVETIMKSANPDYPFEYKFLDDEFDKLFKTESLIEKISNVFATLSIFISCLGLFGLAAYTAAQRTKEIGIRKVLGASSANLMQLLTKDFILLVSIACLLAFPLTWWMMNNWLQSYEYRTPIHWWVFALAGGGALMLTFLTVSFQTIKATRVNPTVSLRSE